MDIDRFKQLVARLETASASAPRAYRMRVAALVLLGFALMALLLCGLSAGLLLAVGAVIWLALNGVHAIVLLGKLLIFAAVPLWYLFKTTIKAMFVRLPAPQGRALSAAEAPALFAAIDSMRQRMRGPRVHHVLLVDDVNAAIVQRPALGLVGWPRNYLLLGLPLLEGMSESEALAVVAHEYGHLAGAHGQFGAFVYRLRHIWAAVQAQLAQLEGRAIAVLARPLMRFVPYFNAYTFVLARADEYAADAASAELVGHAAAQHALKRVNILGSQRTRFIENVFEGCKDTNAPPADLSERWALHLVEDLEAPDAQRWLGNALDREKHWSDTHPTLRARLEALGGHAAIDTPPPPVEGPSAAQAWLGARLAPLRAEFALAWANGVRQPWSRHHDELSGQRERLVVLHGMAERSEDERYERWRLMLRHECTPALVEELAAFNAASAGDAVALYFEGAARLALADEAGLPILDRSVALDASLTKAAAQRAHEFLRKQGRNQEADVQAQRWQARDALEAARAHQLEHVSAQDMLAPHELPAETLQAIRALLDRDGRGAIASLYLARRVIAADPQARQWLLGVEASWWARRLGKQRQVIQRLAAHEWPMPLMLITLDGRYKPLRPKFRALADARLR